jgi:hypothetical protein
MSIQEEHHQISSAEEALLGLARLLKAIAFYPPGHASLQNAVKEAQKGFESALSGGDPLVLTVRRKELLLAEGLSLSPHHPALIKLSAQLFDRRVQTLTFLPGLPDKDLLFLAHCLRLDPGELQRREGMAALLEEEGITSVAVNETDISALLHRREEMESTELPCERAEDVVQPPPPEDEPPPSEAVDPLELLNRLRSDDADYRFRQSLEALAAFIREHLDRDHRHQILNAFDFLLARKTAPEERPSRREEITKALEDLATEDVLRFFVLFLADSVSDEVLQKRLLRVLLFYKRSAVPPLMEHLATEEDPGVRRICLKALFYLGKGDALPAILEYLEDERWNVVHDTVALLGQLRLPETAVFLKRISHHPDIRVRRESIRSLTRIGGSEALRLLLATLNGSDPALKLQALLALGALRDRAAAPALIQLVEAPDRWMKEVEIRKGAIKALGEIGSPEATPLLLKILRTRRLLQRKRVDELRAVAATALGGIASEEAATALKAATEDPSPMVARAAAQALKNFRKDGHESESL